MNANKSIGPKAILFSGIAGALGLVTIWTTSTTVENIEEIKANARIKEACTTSLAPQVTPQTKAVYRTHGEWGWGSSGDNIKTECLLESN